MKKAQELFECLDKRANYIYKQPDGTIWASEYKPQAGEEVRFGLLGKDTIKVNEYGCGWQFTYGEVWCLGRVDVEEFYGLPWDKCLIKKKQSAVRYHDAIGCLGFFWNGETQMDAVMGILARAVRNHEGLPVYYEGLTGYEHFKPIRRYQIKFYED